MSLWPTTRRFIANGGCWRNLYSQGELTLLPPMLYLVRKCVLLCLFSSQVFCLGRVRCVPKRPRSEAGSFPKQCRVQKLFPMYPCIWSCDLGHMTAQLFLANLAFVNSSSELYQLDKTQTEYLVEKPATCYRVVFGIYRIPVIYTVVKLVCML